jgi:hypothetical protein
MISPCQPLRRHILLALSNRGVRSCQTMEVYFYSPAAAALEQGQADWGQASIAAKARVGDQNSVDGRGANP